MRSPGPWGAGLVLGCAAPLQAQLTTPFSRPAAAQVSEVGGKTLSQWIADLNHQDPSVREEAIRAVTQFGSEASRAVPQLIARLRDVDASPRAKAALALSIIEVPKSDVPRVVQALAQRVQEDQH